MKQSVSPMTAGAVIVVVLVLVIAFFVWQNKRSGAGSGGGQQPSGMPAEAQREFQERMRKAGQPGGTTAPSGGGRLGMPPPGVPTSPPGQGR